MTPSLPTINCHIHLPPNFSAFGTVGEAVALAKSQSISVLGSSNYYDLEIYSEFEIECRRASITPILGLEVICWSDEFASRGELINDPANPGKVYLCGKGLRNWQNPTHRAKELMARIRLADDERMAQMIIKLKEVFVKGGLLPGVTHDSIKKSVAARSGVSVEQVTLQERHVAQAFQSAFFELCPDNRKEPLTTILGAEPKGNVDDSVTVQGEIRTHLMKAGKPGYAPEKFISLSEAVELIHELGGLVVYPVVADGMNPKSAFEKDPQTLVRNLTALGIDAAEFISNRNSPDCLSEYVAVLSASGISVTAGTEHNTTELIPLAPECKGKSAIPSDAAMAFFRGTCRLIEWQDGATAREKLEAQYA